MVVGSRPLTLGVELQVCPLAKVPTTFSFSFLETFV